MWNKFFQTQKYSWKFLLIGTCTYCFIFTFLISSNLYAFSYFAIADDFFIIPGWNVPFFDIFYLIIATYFALYIHELGHYLVAKMLSIKAKAIKFTCQFNMFPAAYTEIDTNSFENASWLKRVFVICGGISFNLLLCSFLLLSIAIMLKTKLVKPNDSLGASIAFCKQTSRLRVVRQSSLSLSVLFPPSEIIHSLSVEGKLFQRLYSSRDLDLIGPWLKSSFEGVPSQEVIYWKSEASIVDKTLKQLNFRIIEGNGVDVGDFFDKVFSDCHIINSSISYFRASQIEILFPLLRFFQYLYNISLNMAALNVLPVRMFGFDGYRLWEELKILNKNLFNDRI